MAVRRSTLGWRTGEAVARLTASLEVDTASLTRATGWRPRPVTIDAASVRDHASDSPAL